VFLSRKPAIVTLVGKLASRIVISDHAVTVCEECLIADKIWSRMKGLLGRSSLEPGEGLLIKPAPSIHTWFMRFPIDVVFLDRDLTVVDVVDGLRPFRTASRRSARAVLELAAGEARRRRIERGHRLSLVATGPVPVPVVFLPQRVEESP
jgi:uncharacterized protein